MPGLPKTYLPGKMTKGRRYIPSGLFSAHPGQVTKEHREGDLGFELPAKYSSHFQK